MPSCNDGHQSLSIQKAKTINIENKDDSDLDKSTSLHNIENCKQEQTITDDTITHNSMKSTDQNRHDLGNDNIAADIEIACQKDTEPTNATEPIAYNYAINDQKGLQKSVTTEFVKPRRKIFGRRKTAAVLNHNFTNEKSNKPKKEQRKFRKNHKLKGRSNIQQSEDTNQQAESAENMIHYRLRTIRGSFNQGSADTADAFVLLERQDDSQADGNNLVTDSDAHQLNKSQSQVVKGKQI